jgi:glucosamine 6-phosphate synthetase-like amidotransferase/phosphosugar isomerase protein
MLKVHSNLFILAKGAGYYTANNAAQKYLQVSGLHAEAYPCAEFRHGPLSMIDEQERTPGKLTLPSVSLSLTHSLTNYVVFFLVFDDEHRSQILSNILQVKERGATTVIITDLPHISKLIDANKMDFVI